MDVEGTYKSGPQEFGSVCFETTIGPCYVALDVHAMVQKWNSYGFVSRPYHELPSNLVENFKELNFRGTGRICKNCENYAPRKFGAIRGLSVTIF